MKKRVRFLEVFLFFLLSIYTPFCFATENVFYVLRYHSQDRMSLPINTFMSLKNNYKKIDILIPQAYNINEWGVVDGEIEPDILKFAVQHSMKIMPLVTNRKFSKEIAHSFLSNIDAQTKALETIINICKQNHFYGIQLDFEMINIKDRDALTHFYVLAANELHKNGLLVSFAIAPIVTDKPNSLFLKKIYENWEGAYDLKTLGKAADFVSIMAYNQHGGPTTPGPTATLPWARQAVRYALQYIPSNKISVGIPDFSTHWFTGSAKVNQTEKVSIQMRGINYEKALTLTHQYNEKMIWDKKSSIFYVIFYKHSLNEYLFIENAKSFYLKYKLVKEYKLRGISVFDLGTEDPHIWTFL
jgi:spore germination protein YaaH